jgi:hypothetical protein
MNYNQMRRKRHSMWLKQKESQSVASDATVTYGLSNKLNELIFAAKLSKPFVEFNPLKF